MESFAPSAQAWQRNSGGDASGALHCDVKAGQRFLAQRPLYRGLDAEEDAKRSVRPRIAANIAATVGQSGDIFRRTCDFDHVGDIDADILGGHVASAKAFHSLAEGVEHVRRLGPVRGASRTDLPPPSGSPAIAFL